MKPSRFHLILEEAVAFNYGIRKTGKEDWQKNNDSFCHSKSCMFVPVLIE